MHPALPSRQVGEQQQQTTEEPLPGWASLTREQKDFLAMLPLYKVKAAAARAIGKTPKWLGNQEMNHPRFPGSGEGRSVAEVAPQAGG